MSRHDDTTSMGQVLDHAREAVQMAEGFSRADLNSDRKLELSLTRLVEIVGEAAKRVSTDRRAAVPQIPWKEVVGMRKLAQIERHCLDHTRWMRQRPRGPRGAFKRGW